MKYKMQKQLIRRKEVIYDVDTKNTAIHKTAGAFGTL